MRNACVALKTLLATGLGAGYTILYGETVTPPEADFPLISIVPVSTSMEIVGTGKLAEAQYTIKIVATINKKEFIDTTNATTISFMDELVRLMEERNANGTPKDATVLGVLYNNPDLNDSIGINTEWEIDYTERIEQSYMAKATLTLIAKEQIPNCNT